MLRASRSIADIFEEVSDHALVLTNDAPLATALNRLGGTRMGQLAYTPRLLASKMALRVLGERTISRERAALRMSRELGLDLRQALDAVDRIKEVREHTSRVEGHIPAEDLPVLEAYRELPTVERALERMDLAELVDGPVAVIAPERFNALDREALPPRYDVVDAFAGEAGVGSAYLFDTEGGLVEGIARLLDNVHADDMAVVLNVDSTYLSSIKARLARKGVAINERRMLREHLAVRDLADLLLLMGTGDERALDRLLRKMEVPISGGIPPEVSGPEEHTFGQLLDAVSRKRFPGEMSALMEMMGAEERPMDERAMREMRFALTHFDIEMERRKEGVLLVDCANSMFIDRPVIVHVGLGTDWERSSRPMPFTDRRRQDRLEMDRFQALITQGEVRYAFLNRVKDDRKVIPCFMFDRVLGREVADFGDPFFGAEEVGGSPSIERKEVLPVFGEGEVDMFSQSSLSRFVECPKLYELSRLVREPPSASMMRGTLLHDFAELYAERPDVVRREGSDRIADMMMDLLSPYIEPSTARAQRSDLIIGMRSVMAYLDPLRLEEPVIGGVKREKRNLLAEALDVELGSMSTELWFEEPDIHLKGQIDLVVDRSNIVDYKTGRRSSGTRAFSSMRPSMGPRRVDLQPLAYLLKIRKDVGDRELLFTYCHLLERRREVVSGASPAAGELMRVRYVPMSFNEFILTDECFTVQSGYSTRATFIMDTGKERIREYLREHPFTDEMLFTPYSDDREDVARFEEFALSVRGGSNGKNARSFYKGLIELRNGGHRHMPDVLLFREDLDGFELLIGEMVSRATVHMREGFPCAPLVKECCAGCAMADVCLGGTTWQ